MGKTHGLSKTRLHTIWHSMYCRCYYPTTNQYKNYGGKGVKICNEWVDKNNGFMNFYNWSMNNGYKENLTIDRIDVNGNYEPNNCRWITKKEQCANTTYNVFYTFNGETKIGKQWCDEYNISYTTFKDRLNRGWTLEQTLTIPVKKVFPYKTVHQIDKNTNKIINTFNSVQEASRITGINYSNIYYVCNNKRKTAGGYKWKYE